MRDAKLIEIYYSDRSTRGKRLAARLEAGVLRVGRRPMMLNDREFRGGFWAPTVTFYGLHGRLREVYAAALAQGVTLLFVDLGYWHRELPGRQRWYGYHRVSLNGRHPNDYFQRRKHPSDRFYSMNVPVRFARRPEERGDSIMVPGMSDKAAEVCGLGGVGEWERGVIEEIRRHTDRPIIYRPKPGARRAPPPAIPGTSYSFTNESVEEALRRTWCVVTHHSNVAVDALVNGVPAITTDGGAASAVCSSDVSLVDDPPFPSEKERARFFADLAYTQWTPDEFANGVFWRHVIEEGLCV